ncbi:MAG: hypothetical protein K6T61_14505 [Bryobacteraceae bacterium]|nr:hypothetical protein [Bryobacteraceae bacterium]
MRLLFGLTSLLCLALCLAIPLLHFFAWVDEAAFKQILALSSAGWFLFATLWVSRRNRP